MTLRCWFSGLRAQLVVLLTLTLLPLGLWAILQGLQTARDARDTAQRAFLAKTTQVARQEKLLIERTSGAARAFAAASPALLADPAACAALLQGFVAASPQALSARLRVQPGMPGAQTAGCGTSALQDALDTQLGALDPALPAVIAAPAAAGAGQSVLLVAAPFAGAGTPAGQVVITVQHDSAAEDSLLAQEPGLIDVITFNTGGSVLTSRRSAGDLSATLPAGVSLAALAQERVERAFSAQTSAGADRFYTVAPVAEAPVTVMAIWDSGTAAAAGWRVGLDRAAIGPVLMWVASIIVAFLAMETLVLRHLRRMQDNITQFTDNRQAPPLPAPKGPVPAELAALDRGFSRMRAQILADAAELETALQGKDVLVKEIHHRVKNNLQLISSMINMQIKEAGAAETRSILRWIQSRVLSLATIHQNLYQTESSGQIDAGPLMTEILEDSLAAAGFAAQSVNYEHDIATIPLYPAQAVPLSLFMAEAATNAVKHLGSQMTGPPVLRAYLSQDGDLVTLGISNSIGDAPLAASGGIGSKLMGAFVQQLDGQLEIQRSPTSFGLTLTFRLQTAPLPARNF